MTPLCLEFKRKRIAWYTFNYNYLLLQTSKFNAVWDKELLWPNNQLFYTITEDDYSKSPTYFNHTKHIRT